MADTAGHGGSLWAVKTTEDDEKLDFEEFFSYLEGARDEPTEGKVNGKQEDAQFAAQPMLLEVEKKKENIAMRICHNVVDTVEHSIHNVVDTVEHGIHNVVDTVEHSINNIIALTGHQAALKLQSAWRGRTGQSSTAVSAPTIFWSMPLPAVLTVTVSQGMPL